MKYAISAALAAGALTSLLSAAPAFGSDGVCGGTIAGVGVEAITGGVIVGLLPTSTCNCNVPTFFGAKNFLADGDSPGAAKVLGAVLAAKAANHPALIYYFNAPPGADRCEIESFIF